MTLLSASAAVHHAAKDGNSAAEYEDAWSVARPTQPDEEFDARGWRCAVADGASESLLAGRWAGELVREFAGSVAAADPASFAAAVRRAADRWPAVVARYTEQRENEGRPVKWYERPGLEKGAHATLLTVEVAPGAHDADGTGEARAGWRASALGDTCVFQIRDDDLLTAFPMADSASFDTSPPLVGSRDPDTALLAERVLSHTGDLRGGDDLYLATDALAAWFLTRYERGERPWRVLCDLGVTVGFDEWLARERSDGRMRNDDVTLVHLNAW
ncbi:hypothetical protein ACFO4E_13250 [Nocardiopsis mangrovi]|uniref:Protein phosphatase 2C domain-containing protein n=1 Tax=Nocardiopsis mangrovi TaxID=1179818 RepID=A0ABV9DWL2_9ACTN